MVRSTAVVAGLVLLCAAARVASAQPAPAPAPAPATAPAASQPNIPTDQSTPKSALRVLADAMESGNQKAILGVLLTASPQELRMAQTMAELAGALAELRRQAVTAFGEEGAKSLTGDVSAVAAQGLARLGAAKETITGDKATVSVGEGADAEPPVNLVKHEGKWKYPVAEMSKGVQDPAIIEQGITDAAEHAKLLRDAAAEVGEKKYKTADEVRAALEQRVMQMVMARQKAATQPSATQPQGTSAPAPAPAPAAPVEPKPAP